MLASGVGSSVRFLAHTLRVLHELLLVPLLRSDIVVADFEGADYAGWVATGSAFGPRPAQGTLPNQMVVSGYLGKGLANNFYRGDGSTGSLLSPIIRLERRYMSFLIGGGRDPRRLRLELVVDGRRERVATGRNRVPGGSEALVADGWDLKGLVGKSARVRIVDEATGGWGHINVDHIVMTDRKPSMIIRNMTRSIRIQHRFLNIPIKNGTPARELTLRVGGSPPIRNNVEIADGAADWYASIDVSPWKGKTIDLTLDEASDSSHALSAISNTRQIPGNVESYQEAARGQFHFSPRRGWTNDPNGLVYFRGEYHLFFQHNPYGWGWGNMHWGHAVSKDLVHWTELPIALFPDEKGTIWSGSAVVDLHNTSGFGKPGRPAMVLFYTYAGSPFCQGVAYSIDGRTFTKWSGNPIIPLIAHSDRDPKVIWHEPTKKWVMVLYLEIPEKPTLQFLTSSDLKRWTPVSRIEGFHECPDLFELPVDGKSLWVLTAANSDYQLGTFDGREFRPETSILKGHRGRGFYAAQTFSDVPDRRIRIGWLQTETKGMPFNQSMSIPTQLGLVHDDDGYRMTWTPIFELRKLRASTREFGTVHLDRTYDLGNTELSEIEIEFDPTPNTAFELSIRGIALSYELGLLIVNGHRAEAREVDGKLDIHIFVDRTALEVFASKGRVYVPMPVTLDPQNKSITIKATKGAPTLSKVIVHELKTAWKP